MVPVDNLGTYLLTIIYFIDRYLVPIIFALAFIVFLWGIYSTFIAGAANEEKRQEGQKIAMYGLIGFFVMVSVWGILNLLIHSFGFGVSQRPTLPIFGAPPGASSQSTNPFNSITSPASSGSSGSTKSVCPVGLTDYLDGNGCVSPDPTSKGCGPGQTDYLDGQGCQPDGTVPANGNTGTTPSCVTGFKYNAATNDCVSDPNFQAQTVNSNPPGLR